eukprot:s554_g22.t1
MFCQNTLIAQLSSYACTLHLHCKSSYETCTQRKYIQTLPCWSLWSCQYSGKHQMKHTGKESRFRTMFQKVDSHSNLRLNLRNSMWFGLFDISTNS